MYNRVNYYDPQVAEKYIKEGLEEWKARRNNATQPRTACGIITWREWSGGARSRTFTEHTYSGEYELKGDWLIFNYRGKRKKLDNSYHRKKKNRARTLCARALTGCSVTKDEIDSRQAR